MPVVQVGTTRWDCDELLDGRGFIISPTQPGCPGAAVRHHTAGKSPIDDQIKICAGELSPDDWPIFKVTIFDLARCLKRIVVSCQQRQVNNHWYNCGAPIAPRAFPTWPKSPNTIVPGTPRLIDHRKVQCRARVYLPRGAKVGIVAFFQHIAGCTGHLHPAHQEVVIPILIVDQVQKRFR